jgi:hypothetical protein
MLTSQVPKGKSLKSFHEDNFMNLQCVIPVDKDRMTAQLTYEITKGRLPERDKIFITICYGAYSGGLMDQSMFNRIVGHFVIHNKSVAVKNNLPSGVREIYRMEGEDPNVELRKIAERDALSKEEVENIILQRVVKTLMRSSNQSDDVRYLKTLAAKVFK